MTFARIRQRVAAARAELDAIDRLLDEQERAEASGERVIFATIADYAVRHGVSEATVGRWLKAGMPVQRRGSIVRIPVEAADAWTPEASRQRSAEHAAHRGDRSSR